MICPQRYSEPLAPAVAAERAGRPLEWESINAALNVMAKDSDVMVVEGIGGVMVPMDAKYTFLDVIAWLGAPVVIVARPDLGTINHTLLTIMALRSRQARISGVVVNGYPTDTPTAAQETNPRVIEKRGKTPILCIVPQVQMPKDLLHSAPIPAAVAAAIATVDWMCLTAGAIVHVGRTLAVREDPPPTPGNRHNRHHRHRPVIERSDTKRQ